MPLPWTFANATTLFTVRLDDDFNALGALTVIPCTATGTNTIALTPASNTPTISAYTNLSPVFAFLAAASNSGATTINVNGIGAKNVYKNNGATAAGSGDIVSGGLYLVSYNSALNGAVGGFVIDNPSISANTTTTRLITGGPLTYTPPAGAVRFRVRMGGPGGGGGGATANAGAASSADTSFQVNSTGTAWTAVKGAGGAASAGFGGLGGTGGTDGSTGNLIFRASGGPGGGGCVTATAGTAFPGGIGGYSVFGGSRAAQGTAGGNAIANSCAGGAGGGGNAAGNSGSGGGAGEYVEFWVTGMTTATYTVGAGGAGGAAGTNAGGNGAAGIIIIEEFYI